MDAPTLAPTIESSLAQERLAELEHILAHYGPRGQTILLEVLHDAQALFDGWLPEPALRRIATYLDVPLADVYGVTEFYDMFHTEPVGRQLIRVCVDGPCAVRGSDALLAALGVRLGCAPGQTTADGAVTLEAVRCLGLCDRAPAALVNGTRHAPAAVDALLDGSPVPAQLKIGGLVKVALTNVGVVDPTSLDDYRAQGGMAAALPYVDAFVSGHSYSALAELVRVGNAVAHHAVRLSFRKRIQELRVVVDHQHEEHQEPRVVSVCRVRTSSGLRAAGLSPSSMSVFAAIL